MRGLPGEISVTSLLGKSQRNLTAIRLGIRKTCDGIRKIREKGSDPGEGPLKFQVLKDTNFE
jgi:hypothetical protein